MIRTLTLLLALAACMPPPEPRVLVIGLDGVRLDVLAEAHTPHLDALAAGGLLMVAHAVEPTVSGPNWSSILTGVGPDKHGVLSNDFSTNAYNRYPDFLTRLELANPDFRTAAVVTWPPLGSPASGGPLVGPMVDQVVLIDGDALGYTAADSLAADAAADLLRRETWDALFVYFGDIDEAGHRTDSFSPEYRAAIETADRQVGRLLEALRTRPAREDWLVLVTTDHGRRDDGGHGRSSAEERTSFVLASGRSAPRTPPPARPWVYDVAATALAHLGVALDPAWELDGHPVTSEAGVTLPALVDHHAHLVNVGFWLLNDRDAGRLFLDLSRATSMEEIGRLVTERARAHPEGAWIVGAGWNQGRWGTQAMPGHDVLTRAAPRHPVFLARSDGHAGWVNARAMAAAGVNRSGVLLERENEPVIRHIPTPADSDVVAAFQLAARALAGRGVAEVYDAGVLAFPGVVALNADLGRYLALLLRADSLEPLARVNLMIPAPSALADSLLAGDRRWALTPRIRVTHLKLFGDGALGSRGAALTHPYADDPGTRGVARMTAGEILDWSRRALDAGLGVATHAIGDEAVKRALDAYERLRSERDVGPDRLRIEHFSYAREEDFARAVRLGVTLSIQSGFNAAVAETLPLGALRVGRANEPRVYAWRRLYDMGAHLVEGSDAFGRPGTPLAGFHAAMSRRHTVGLGHDTPAMRATVYRMHAGPESGDSVWWSGDPMTLALDRIRFLSARRIP
jgi:predicted amidohydrolase YtcJ